MMESGVPLCSACGEPVGFSSSAKEEEEEVFVACNNCNYPLCAACLEDEIRKGRGSCLRCGEPYVRNELRLTNLINIDLWSYVNIADKVSQENTNHGDSGVRLRTAAHFHDHQVEANSESGNPLWKNRVDSWMEKKNKKKVPKKSEKAQIPVEQQMENSEPLEAGQPLSRIIPISPNKLTPYRAVIIMRLIVLGLFFNYRITNPVNSAYGLWLTSVICEIWFAVSWVLDQFPKWSPINRETYIDRLSARYVLCNDYDEYERSLLISQMSFEKTFGQSSVFIESTLMENGGVPESANSSTLIQEAIHVISCGYEEKTEWGKELSNIATVWFLGLFISIILTSVLELRWSGVGIEDLWRNEQFWVIGGVSAHLFAVFQGFLKMLAGIDTNFTVTAKATDDAEFGELYVFKWTTVLIPPTTILVVNIVGVVAGFSDALNSGYEAWGPLFGKVFFALWVILHLYPFLKGLMGRQNRTPTIVVLWSVLLASVFSLLWVKIDPFINDTDGTKSATCTTIDC
ncbi:hypothetical protein BHE74_00008249 [Ensete ventricosum]|nr:hypothetical protein BHE74_00008249 [Ensete ventricosum]